MTSLADRRLTVVLGALCVLVTACQDKSTHVYQAPPPPMRVPPPTAPPPPDAPFGSTGAQARITSVADARTGGPASLSRISVSFDVMTLVARGPGRPVREGATVELVVRGRADATLSLNVPSPASTIIAHVFRVDPREQRLPPGHYTMEARVRGGDGTLLASSVPQHFDIR